MRMFNEDQTSAIDFAISGRNLFITGSAGTGKSFVVRYLSTILPNVTLTSTTGIGASIIGGITVHSALQIGHATEPREKLAKSVHVAAAFNKIDILIIDEISMLSGEILTLIDAVAKDVRSSDKPFGGIQIICSGDFLQLPPVSGSFAFESDAWKDAQFETIEFKKIIRQSDKNFVSVLQKIRVGIVDKHIRQYFRQRFVKKDTIENMKIKPTMLFSHRDIANRFNESCLGKLLEQNKKYTHSLSVHTKKSNYNNIHVPEKLDLCVGAQVILIANLDVPRGLVNGSRGVITGFEGEFPVIEFASCTEVVKRRRWEITKDDKVVYSYSQVPLLLGWAITIHRSQGMTLDNLVLDLAECFTDGQIYVALSRARSIESLYLFRIDWMRISANKKALEFYRKDIQ